MILIGRQLDFTLESEIDWTKRRRSTAWPKSLYVQLSGCRILRKQFSVVKRKVQRRRAAKVDTISGGHNEGVPPVPIPNTEVKPFSAESTWLETAREDRSLPDSNMKLERASFFISMLVRMHDRICIRSCTMPSFS